MQKRVRKRFNCRLKEPLSSLFPSLFYLSHVKPRLPPFTCQCIYNSELSAPGCVGGETSSSLCQHRGPDPDLNRQDRTISFWTGQNRCVNLFVRVFVIGYRRQHVYPSVCDRLFPDRTCFQSSVSRRYNAGALP